MQKKVRKTELQRMAKEVLISNQKSMEIIQKHSDNFDRIVKEIRRAL